MRKPLLPFCFFSVYSYRQLAALAALLFPLCSQAQFSPPPISGTTPARNANSVPLGTDVSLTYTEAINSTPANNAVHVFSQQAGGHKVGTTTVFGNRLTFDPAQNFKPGEVVYVTALPGVPASSRAKRYVYQFTTQAGVGPATFSKSTAPVDGQPSNVVAVDVNNDGNLDFLTTNRTITNTGNVSVRLGNGQGAFSGTTIIPLASDPSDLVAGDVNGDGNLDFLTLSSTTGTGTVSIRLGNGQAGFTAVPDVLVASNNYPQKIALADVNADGNLDLLTTEYGSANPVRSGQVSIRFGNGQGGFSGTTNVALNLGTRHIAVADVNGDGNLDLLTGTVMFGSISTVSVRMGDGQGNFSGITDIPMPAGSSLYSLVAADVNNDGNLDFLTSNITNSNNPSDFVSTYLGNGQGGFSFANSLSFPIGFSVPIGSPFQIQTADVNGDGNLDLVTANFSDQGTVSVRLGDGQGRFSGTLDVPAGFRPTDLAVGDIDGDGDLDLLVANYGDNAVGVLRNQPVPRIFMFSPTSGTVGRNVIINGANFIGATAVTFNGVAATNFAVNSANQITVTVPAGATTGPIAVTTPAATATSSTLFQVTQAPMVTTTAGTTTALEQVATIVDAGLGVNSLVLTSAAVRITSGLVALEDVLDVTLVNGFSYNYNNGVLTITGRGTIAQWQALLRTVTYTNKSANPTTTPRTISFVVSDGIDSSAPATKVVQIQAVNGAPAIPVDADLAANTIAERAAMGTPVGITVAATDSDSPTLTYSLTNDAGGRFTINSSTGVVTVANGALLNYAVATSHVITAQASDGTLASSQSFTIQVTPVNNAPVIANQTFTIADNSPSGLLVGTIVASDPDAGQTLTYALQGSNTSGAFTLVDNELRVLNPAALMSSLTSTFSLSVRVTDNGTPALSTTALVTVQLTRVACTTPVLTPPADQRVVAISGQCGASAAFTATATGTPAPTVSYAVNGTTITSPYVFPVGTTSVTVTATNTCGTTTESFTVTVEDRQAPIIRAAGFITAIESNGLRTIEAADVDWGSFDECSGIASMRISPRTFTCANIGPNQVMLTVTDNAGNSASETVTVFIIDNTAPVIVAADFETTLIDGTRTIEATNIDYGSYDQCGSIASMSISPRTFTCANVGANPVTLTVTDNSGNVSSQTVTVVVQGDATCTTSIASSNYNGPVATSSSNESQLQAYPNPVTDQATVSFRPTQAGLAQVRVYNPLGV
ncbi:FG-GAP-like repeat-containing protein, partial [Hymenobacter norwichensis]|uniref:FG-GAP-like repeat-containing protein n=1 Tax=Hymenobacter norwichensis TaxID=223903 RepID=UPI0012F841FD